MKKIKRRLHLHPNDRKVTRGHTYHSLRLVIPALSGQALNIAIAATLLAALIAVAAVIWLRMTFPEPAEAALYIHKLEQSENTPAAKAAWKRLWTRHGYPGVVIYSPGQTLYFINSAGQKCPFI